MWVWIVAACPPGAFQRHRAASATKAAAVAEQRAAVEAATSEAERCARQGAGLCRQRGKAADSYAAGVARCRALLLTLLAASATACSTLSPQPPWPVEPPRCRPPAELMTPPVVRSVLGECKGLFRQWLAADADAAS